MKGKALITGASSGIGKDIAFKLSSLGYDLILVARNKEKLKEVKKNLNTNVQIYSLDLSKTDNCYSLYDKVKDENIEILINNAGFGMIGEFVSSDLDKELNMIDLNIKAVHILTKLFLKDFYKKNKGYILNVSSSAAFQPGPLMGTYYSTKSYVYNLTLGIYEELKKSNSNVQISVLCPGPVDTNFNNVVGCKFHFSALNSRFVADYAIKKLFKGKLLIVPGFKIKLLYFFERFVPIKLKLKMTYNIQNAKTKK